MIMDDMPRGFGQRQPGKYYLLREEEMYKRKMKGDTSRFRLEGNKKMFIERRKRNVCRTKDDRALLQRQTGKYLLKEERNECRTKDETSRLSFRDNKNIF